MALDIMALGITALAIINLTKIEDYMSLFHVNLLLLLLNIVFDFFKLGEQNSMPSVIMRWR